MSEENTHNNPWADKLQHVNVPDVNDNWNNMQTLLDKEMPVSRYNSSIKWLLLLLLLLLVIGVCNCPGLYRGNKISQKHAGNPSLPNVNRQPTSKPTRENLTNKPIDETSEKTNQALHKTITKGSDVGNILEPSDSKISEANSNKQMHVSGQLKTLGDYTSVKSKNRKNIGMTRIYSTRQADLKSNLKGGRPEDLPESRHDKNPAHKPKAYITAVERQVSSNSNRAKNGRDNQKQMTVTDSGSIIQINTDTGKIPKANRLTDTLSLTRNDHAIDTINKTGSASKRSHEADSTNKPNGRGFVVAIGLNQFFPIGNQQHSSYNSNGTSGVLADYIPVPQLRYHFNRKLYVQLEAQFNMPQYTGNILARQSPPDSSRPGPPTQRSVYIKKLFYFNLPLSVHYKPVKNVSLGAGLQFSQLNNAVGLFENRLIGGGPRDTGSTAKLQSLKSDDTTYGLLKTREWRFLIDANYQWKKFSLGLRYNQAFNYFINVQVSNATITQARNKSLQLYLRYDIWDGRKK